MEQVKKNIAPTKKAPTAHQEKSLHKKEEENNVFETEHPLMEGEDPEIIPYDDPFENPPPFEIPEPGEGP